MAENEGERQWIVEPPGQGEIALHLSVGDGVKLTVEQERAVADLLRTLEAAEVSGYAGKCPKQASCGTMRCPAMYCEGTGGLSCGSFKDSKVAAGGWTLMGTFGGIT